MERNRSELLKLTVNPMGSHSLSIHLLSLSHSLPSLSVYLSLPLCVCLSLLRSLSFSFSSFFSETQLSTFYPLPHFVYHFSDYSSFLDDSFSSSLSLKPTPLPIRSFYISRQKYMLLHLKCFLLHSQKLRKCSKPDDVQWYYSKGIEKWNYM